MNSDLNIAIVGCGIAGSTAAFLLSDQGFRVTVFEQAEQCGPVGAGILLQPSGQRILGSLGLLEPILASSARIAELHATQRNGRELVRVRYDTISSELFGLGVHRGTLFTLLFQQCLDRGIQMVNGCEVVSVSQNDRGVELFDSKNNGLGSFDLVVAADGSGSELRNASSLRCRLREYDYAALWATGPCTSVSGKLLQVVAGTTRLVGLLPIGNGQCSFFWGLHRSEREPIRQMGLDRWKQVCVSFSPVTDEVVASINSLDDLVFAGYRNVSMPRAVDRRLVFIGDAAHATSPHLGQGVNLALADAVSLAEQIRFHADLPDALRGYEAERRSTTRFYTRLTGLLTPFFQSGQHWRAWGRDLCLPWMPRIPFIGRQMALTMAGLKTGWLTDDWQSPQSPSPTA